MVSYCDRLIVRRPSSTIASKDNYSSTTGWILTKLDPYMALFNNFSNTSSPFISRSHRLEQIFDMKTSCLKAEGIEP